MAATPCTGTDLDCEAKDMNRRRLLTGLVAAGVLLGVGAGRMCRAAAGPAHRLLATLRQPSSAARVGQAFLAAYPGERDAEALTEEILTRVSGAHPIGTRRLRQAISREIRQDFASGRVVSVDGWILSETEAKLCGLVALLTG
jgi:hypothetical protein